mgnify:CR=1 FL=1
MTASSSPSTLSASGCRIKQLLEAEDRPVEEAENHGGKADAGHHPADGHPLLFVEEQPQEGDQQPLAQIPEHDAEKEDVGEGPRKEEGRFSNAFQDLDKVTISLKDPNEEPRLSVPVRLKNLAFVKPFEMFVDMYGLPSYQELDPTPYVAFTAYSRWTRSFSPAAMPAISPLMSASTFCSRWRSFSPAAVCQAVPAGRGL